MEKHEIDSLAEALVAKVREGKHEFWIDPEEHYNQHRESVRLRRAFNDEEISTLKDLLKLFRTTRGLFWRAFIGFAVLGTIIVAVIGVLFSFKTGGK